MMKIECSTSVKMIFSDILVFKMKKKRRKFTFNLFRKIVSIWNLECSLKLIEILKF